MKTLNVASSFATALLLCLTSEKSKLNTNAFEIASELDRLKRDFGPVRNLLDLLFNNSRRREHIFDLESIIIENREEITRLGPHKAQLEFITQSEQ